MTKITLRSYNREIEALTDQGKIDVAIAHCLHILKFFPKHVETYRLLGKAYLENQRLGDAADVFQRVLSAVPDDFVSHIGMSIIREDEGNLDAAIWHMQRAYDVQSSNITIQDELRRLYDKRDGIEPPKIRLTRAALARMYARGDLVAEAIAELRSALQEEPDRTDLLVLLARMYFVNQQRVKCIQSCSQVLNKLPFCLEANLTISQALQETNRADEAEPYLERARELDPYSAFLSANAPRVELVPDQAVTLLMLDESDIRTSTANASQPAWVTSLGEEMDTPVEEEASIDWLLEESAPHATPADVDDFSDEPDLAASLAASAAFGYEEEERPAAAAPPTNQTGEIDLADLAKDEDTAIPDWMETAGWEPAQSEQPTLTSFDRSQLNLETEPDVEEDYSEPVEIEPVDETDAAGDLADSGLFRASIPDWLQALAPSELSEETAPNLVPDEPALVDPNAEIDLPTEESPLPAWLQELDIDETIPGDAVPKETEEVPEWLQEFDAGETVMANDELESEIPDWLKDTGDSDEETGTTEPVSASNDDEIPAWLRDLEVSDDAPEMEVEMPDWMAGAAMDFGEETAAPSEEMPDWLLEMEKTRESADEDAAAGQAAEDDDVPDWLRDMAERAETSSSSADTPSDRTGVTLWLQRNAPQEEEPTEAPVGMEASDEAFVMPEAGEEAGLETVLAEENGAEADIPDWLQDLDAELLDEEEPARTGEPEGEMEVAMEQPQVETTGAEEMEKTASFDMEFDDDALRWLEGLAAKQGASEDELLTAPDERTDTPPEWIQSMAAGYAEEEAASRAETAMTEAGDEAGSGEATVLETPAAAHDADTLDWDEFEAESEALPEPDQAAAAAAAAALAWTPGLDDETDESEAEFIAQAEEPAEDTPAWSMPAAQAEEQIPEWLQDEEIETPAGGPELPSWLQGIDIEEEEGEEQTEAETAAGMPAWLQETIITSSPFRGAEEETAEEEPELSPETEASLEEDEAYSWEPDWTAGEAVAEAEIAQEEMPAEDELTGESEMPAEQEAVEEEDEEAFTVFETAEPEIETAPAGEFAAWLGNARQALTDGDKPAALHGYQSLIREKANLPEVINDLKEALQYDHPVDIDIWATLGDAYARNNNLQDALDAYTKAEGLLR